MENKLISYFSKMTTLSSEESEAMSGNMLIRQFSKGTLLLKEGQIAVDTYFIMEGCIRQYFMVDGDEKTTDFYTEDQWVISLNSLPPVKPSDYFLICNEDTTVVIGNEKEALELFKKFPRLEAISREVMQRVFTEQHEKMTSFMTDIPENRYLKLLKSKPDLVQRIPQYQLASYIGVKPESLSRIRKRIFVKK